MRKSDFPTLRLGDPFVPRGPISRGSYFLWALILFFIKVNLNKYVALTIGKRWIIQWSFPGSELLFGGFGAHSLRELSSAELAALALCSAPFVWTGLVLTLRRLQSIGAPQYLALLFFFPIVNVLLFALLSLWPSREEIGSEDLFAPGFLRRVVPKHEMGAAALALGVSVTLGLLLTLFSTYVLRDYGAGLFMGVPFIVGFLTVMLSAVHRPVQRGAAVRMAASATICMGLLVLGFGIEGLICVVMAAPLAFVLAFLGALLACSMQRAAPAGMAALALPVLLVGVQIADTADSERFSEHEVTTSIVVDAPPERVWGNVVSFPDLPPPQHWIFRTGIAYPIGARIEGRGVGAIRHCRFSTGSFVEPITVWNEPALLKFSVISNPPPMDEYSLFHDLHPPHLLNFFESRAGQFELRRLEGDRTLLTGTTWYVHRIGPDGYWRLFTDAIIHRVHRRVLEHVKQLAENVRE